MKKQLLRDTLPILAAAYGRQFGVSIRIGGDQAYTNGQIIQLPLIEDPDLKNVVLGYLVHEAAHIRLTDFQIWNQTKSGIERSLANIFEDVRIEKGMYDNEYPGTKNNLCGLWDYSLASKKSMVTDNPAALFINYILYRSRFMQYGTDVLKYAYETTEHAVEEQFPKGLFVRLDVLFDKYFDSMTSTLDAHNFAIEVIEALKQAEEEEKADQKEQNSGSDSNSEEGNDDSSNDSGDSGDSSNQGNDTTSESKDSDSCSNSNSDSNAEDNSQDGDSGGEGDSSLTEKILAETNLPQDALEEIANELSKAAEDEEAESGHGRVQISSDGAGSEVDNTTWGRGDAETLKDGLLHSSKLRAQLTGFLQSQTKARNSHREYGSRFDSKRIARAVSGERRIWKHKTKKELVDTSVHILLDKSGSMGGHTQIVANNATLSLAMAISQVPKADVAVSIFPGVSSSAVSPVIKRNVPVRPKLESFAVPSSGSTPMGEAMFFAAQELANVSTKNRKVLIVITDGEPNNSDFVAYINRLIEPEIDVYAIGIGDSSVRYHFRNHQVINRVEDLQKALFDLAKSFLKVA